MTISAKVIAASENVYNRKQIWTFELVYPRFIHSELMTHRLFSRNAASSRAIPIEKMIESIQTDCAIPVHWGKNQPGMQANEELTGESKISVQFIWVAAMHDAIYYAKRMHGLGAHKQIVNRILEPFQHMKTVVTATEWENWFFLRNHPDAQPEIRELARVMYNESTKIEPVMLCKNQWHTPYFGNGYWCDVGDGLDHLGYSLQEALMISASCCAQTSFRTTDDSLEKAEKVFSRLNLDSDESIPKHASPVEHAATPIFPTEEWGNMSMDPGINLVYNPETWQEGITSYHKKAGFMSGNFAGWIQYRQLIKNEAKW